MKNLLLLVCCLASCGESTSRIKEAMDSRNNLQNIPGAVTSFELTLNRLPDSGSVSRLWSAYWWPLSDGGTSSTRYGNPSPLKKHDIVTGRQANSWEIMNAKKYTTVAWAGKCNGVAAASTMMEEPQRPVFYKNVWFSVIDIKALLAEMWQGSGYIVGDRCDQKRVTYDAYGRVNERECRDVNPATFHLALTNYLGRFGKAIIGDKDPSEAVWNYPIQSFKVHEKTWLSKKEAAFKLHKFNKDDDASVYTYNATATEFVYIKSSVTFLGFAPRNYEYILELDYKGKILGGEWLDTNKSDHPDFLWRVNDPKPENPELDVPTIMLIYKQSI